MGHFETHQAPEKCNKKPAQIVTCKNHVSNTQPRTYLNRTKAEHFLFFRSKHNLNSFTSFGVDLSKSVVAQFVHQTVEHGRAAFGVDPEEKQKKKIKNHHHGK